jgi:flagellar hook-associated protein 1 FlgK
MLSFQRSYEGAARVLTAIDDMLDTLINKTGSVGR